jgi:hypothetical protein
MIHATSPARWRARVLASVVLMTLVAILHVLPDARFFRDLGDRYQGIHFAATVDEPTYLSRISRVLAGDYHLGNAMVFEHRSDPFTYAPLPEYVEGTAGRLLRLSIVHVDVAATAVLPALVFALFLLLLRDLTGRFGLSLVGAAALTLGHYLIAKDSPLWHGRLFDPDFPHSLQFARPVSPQFHYLVLLLALWLLVRLYARPGRARLVVVAGVAVGLAFYLNFFFWTFLLAGLTLWAGLALAERDRPRFRAALGVVAMAVLVGGYALLNSYRAVSTDGFDGASLRAGFIYTRAPILPALHVAWLALFAVWCWRRRTSVPERFLLLFLVGGLACLNQQVLTGRTVQPFHWETQTNKVAMLLSFLVVVGAGLTALERAPEPWRRRATMAVRATGVAALGVLLLHGWLVQENHYAKHRDRFVALQPLGPALRWLRTATPYDSVVLCHPAEPLRSELVTVYAQRYTYLSEPFFTVSLLTQREIDDRYLVAVRTLGLQEAEVRRVLDHNSGALFLGMQVLPYYHRGDDRGVRRHLEHVAARYRRVNAGEEPFVEPPYRLDYVLVSAEELARLNPGRTRLGREVFGDGRFHVFEVRRERAGAL